MKKITIAFSLLSLSIMSLGFAWFVTKDLFLNNNFLTLDIGNGKSFSIENSILWDKDYILYESIETWSGTANKSLYKYELPYGKENLRSIRQYFLPNWSTLSDGPYLRKVISIDAFIQSKYLYLKTSNDCSIQSYLLNVSNKKRKKYPTYSIIWYDDKYFIWRELLGCGDGITVVVSNPNNIFDVKKATFDKTYMLWYDVSSFAMSGDFTLIINFEGRWENNTGQTIVKSLDLSTINRKKKTQKYFFKE